MSGCGQRYANYYWTVISASPSSTNALTYVDGCDVADCSLALKIIYKQVRLYNRFMPIYYGKVTSVITYDPTLHICCSVLSTCSSEVDALTILLLFLKHLHVSTSSGRAVGRASARESERESARESS